MRLVNVLFRTASAWEVSIESITSDDRTDFRLSIKEDHCGRSLLTLARNANETTPRILKFAGIGEQDVSETFIWFAQ